MQPGKRGLYEKYKKYFNSHYYYYCFFQLLPTRDEWIKTATEFGKKNIFWKSEDVIEGKHTAIKKSVNSGSLYYNYKGFHSIVLLIVDDVNKQFLKMDTEINVRISNGGVLFYSKFGELLEGLQLADP